MAIAAFCGAPAQHSVKLSLCLLLSILQLGLSSFSVVVPYGDSVCFAVRTPKARSLISGSYEVVDDGDTPLHVILHDSEGRDVWVSDADDDEGMFSVEGSGRYELCLVNDFHGWSSDSSSFDETDRTVGFSVRVTPLPRGTDGEEMGPDDKKTAELISSTTKLLDMLENMEDHQDFVRSREEVHRNLTEGTFKRVVRWTALEALVLMLIAGGQVLFLKKSFEKKTYM